MNPSATRAPGPESSAPAALIMSPDWPGRELATRKFIMEAGNLVFERDSSDQDPKPFAQSAHRKILPSRGKLASDTHRVRAFMWQR